MVAVSTSWALGFVSVFAPAGLGVREAVLYFFVNNWMEQTDAILFVNAEPSLDVWRRSFPNHGVPDV